MEFSFEYQAERIYASKTKEYFREVISSYNNGNYRSAVVMLYSVVICDLVYKLTELKDVYNDVTAIAILEGIDEKQKQKPTSSEWENDLVEEVFKRTELINNAENEAIQYLKKHRHLSAHPVINEYDILFEPNKEIVRSHMRSMLEGVLLKAPLLSQKIVGTLLTNLADISSQNLNHNELGIFLKNRYFNYFTWEVESSVFKSLWKMVFILINENTVANRFINFQALDIMYKNNPVKLKEFIRNESRYFSNIQDEDAIKNLYVWVCRNPEIYNILDGSCKSLITTQVSQSFNLMVSSWFITGDLEQHIDQLQTSLPKKFRERDSNIFINQKDFEYLLGQTNSKSMNGKVYDLFIKLYELSRSYDEADYYFDRLIKPHLNLFSEDQILTLLKITGENAQIYDRKNFRNSAFIIKSQAQVILGEDYDFSGFPKFNSI